jgi:hypothetical protein
MDMTDLSPAAQAVWHAAWSNTEVRCGDIEGTRKLQIAAALRALAAQFDYAGAQEAANWTAAIATELSSANNISENV